jgi:hypothetical protein
MTATDRFSFSLAELAAVDLFLSEVRAEIFRARRKFPSSDAATVALTEETGELAKACMEESIERVRAEAVQVASTAMRIALEGDVTLDGVRVRRGQIPFAEIFGTGPSHEG